MLRFTHNHAQAIKSETSSTPSTQTSQTPCRRRQGRPRPSRNSYVLFRIHVSIQQSRSHHQETPGSRPTMYESRLDREHILKMSDGLGGSGGNATVRGPFHTLPRAAAYWSLRGRRGGGWAGKFCSSGARAACTFTDFACVYFWRHLGRHAAAPRGQSQRPAAGHTAAAQGRQPPPAQQGRKKVVLVRVPH